MAPPLQRGALVAIAADGTKRSIAFQYNPDTLHRTLEPNTVGGRPGSRSRAVRFAGAPTESITMDCRFSSADATGPDAAQGVAPQLAALSLLLYPASADVTRAQRMLDLGVIEVLPALADELLFIFGGSRTVPVELTSATIVEELYDQSLVPVIATVTLTLRAVSYSDVGASNPAFDGFLAYQRSLEQLAASAYDTAGPSGS